MKNLLILSIFMVVSCTTTKKFRTNPYLKKYSGIFGTSSIGPKYTLDNDTTTFQIDTLNYLSFKDLKGVSKSIDNFSGQPNLTLTFNENGTQKLKTLSESHLQRPMLFLINNQLILAPYVQEVISGGKIQISGRFTLQEIDDLYQQLVQKETK